MTLTTVVVTGLVGEGRINSVSNALHCVKGIKHADFDLGDNQATIIYDDDVTNVNVIHRAIKDGGFDPKVFKIH